MSLGDFLHDEQYGGSWADEVEDSFGSQPLPPSTRTGYSSYGGGDRPSYPSRDTFPTQLPTKPPYTAHLGNLSYEATDESVNDFFADCEITSVRIIEDRIEQRPKGFAYAEFATVDGLKKALTLDGTSFQGRTIKVRIADPPKEREGRGDFARDLSSWERKGPLADAPRSDRRPNDFGERRGPPRDGPIDDGKVRDFGNWERRGPLSPLPQAERPSSSRDSSRPRGTDRTDSFRKDRKASPATWGEGRQEGSRPPREARERPERPERPERAPTAADLDNKWRSNMRPDPPVKTPEQSRDNSEAPSPAGPVAAVPAIAPVGRPKLQLQKRTVSESPDVASPGLSSAGGENKANPFGAARPIDTAAKEREIADKREQVLKEKREADEKAKEEKRLAKETAAKEAAEKEAKEAQEAAEAEKAKEEEAEEKVEPPAQDNKEVSAAADGGAAMQRIPSRPRDGLQNPKTTRATESGNWRSASGDQRQGRGGYVNASRGRGDVRGRGGASRGARGSYEGRPPRANGNATPASPQQPAQPGSPAPEGDAAPTQDPDGWTTVPSKGRRGQSTRS
ncbi:hypothetical protein F5Y15DRAFT_414781 [Xylariaceae sp. FL0016]|nr:hypothetical protein F5Y15DRAFT_414781 [Xylariaceae sp. FL0016]